MRRRDVLALAVLVLAPLVAFAPAWWEDRLLGPGDGAALHFPLRVAVWESWARGELPSWNPSIFLGSPLLASFRAGALFPPTVLATLIGDTFLAFQSLVLFSMSAAAALMYLYLRRLGAHPLGSLLAGLSYALGPYLVTHLADTATLTAAPALPLVLLAAEAHLRRARAARAAGLGLAVAILLLAGSPEAARAGLTLLAGRIALAYLPRRDPRAPRLLLTAVAVLGGTLLAGPQLLPFLDAAREAGRAVSGLAGSAPEGPPGLTGLALRYLASTPAPALALAALPLFRELLAVRVLLLALGLSLLLQWGRGPLSDPGALPLVFDVALCVLAGLSLSAQWVARRDERGARLRRLFLAGSVLSAVALSVAAAAGGPLPETLAGAVGLLAVSQILYHANADAAARARATAWVLPLVAAFLMHPHGRRVWSEAPLRAELLGTTPRREAVERLQGPRRAERVLSLVDRWPAAERDLAYASLAALRDGRSLNGYDPLVPLRTRQALGGMGPGGALPASFLRSDPWRLRHLGTGFVQLPSSSLLGPAGERIDLVLDRPRFVPLPQSATLAVVLVTALSDAVQVPQGSTVAEVEVRLASGRSFTFPLRAGLETAEWAWDRPDVKGQVRHRKATVADTWRTAEGWPGNRYRTELRLPGRYWVDAIRLVPVPRSGVLTVFAAGTLEGTVASRAAAFVSDTGALREVLSMPGLRVFEVPGSAEAWVAAGARVMASDAAVLGALEQPRRSGVDLSRQALTTAPMDVAEGRAGRATLVRTSPRRLDVRAEGPGILVVAEAWDPGWSARLDGRPVPVRKVDHALMGVVLPHGQHRVTFEHTPRGFRAAVLVATGTLLFALGAVLRERRRTPSKAP
jgi:hypothetical protein